MEDLSKPIFAKPFGLRSTEDSTPDDLRALVAVDLGAESCRVSLLRWMDGKPALSLAHRFPNHARRVKESLRWDLHAIESGVLEGLRRCAALAPEGVRSIAVDGWAVDYVLLDDDGAAIADPFCYRDERTVASQESLHLKLSSQRMRELTGVQISRINTVYQLHAEPAGHRNRPWLNIPEYLLYRLGARRVAERSNASHTQLLALAENHQANSNSSTWCGEIFEAAGIDPAGAPELVAPGTRIGRLPGELAGLAAFKDTLLIAPATHDTASAIAGIPAGSDDWAYISSGTWSLVGTLLASPNNSPAAQSGNYSNLAGVGGSTLFHRNVNGMWLLRQCMDRWSHAGTVWSLPDLIAAAGHVPPPLELLEVDDPDLLLPGDMPARINRQRHRRGLISLDTSARNAPGIASLIFHSLAARYAQVLADVSELTGKSLSRIYIVGGGSQNLLLNRLTEAATGIAVIRGSQESSTIGNLAVQLAALESNTGGSPTLEEVARWASVLSGLHEEQQTN